MLKQTEYDTFVKYVILLRHNRQYCCSGNIFKKHTQKN